MEWREQCAQKTVCNHIDTQLFMSSRIIGQNNRIHSPNDGDLNSVTLLGATIVDVRTPQNAALVGKNGCINDASIGVYGQSAGPSPFGGIGVAGACDAGCGVAGIAIAGSASSTVLDLPPNSTGVYGKGDFHGVCLRWLRRIRKPMGGGRLHSTFGSVSCQETLVYRRTGKRYSWRVQCSSERAHEAIALDTVQIVGARGGAAK